MTVESTLHGFEHHRSRTVSTDVVTNLDGHLRRQHCASHSARRCKQRNAWAGRNLDCPRTSSTADGCLPSRGGPGRPPSLPRTSWSPRSTSPLPPTPSPPLQLRGLPSTPAP